MVAMGRSSALIASSLGVATSTVESHVRHCLDKLGARNRAHAIALGLRDGEISLELDRSERAPGPAARALASRNILDFGDRRRGHAPTESGAAHVAVEGVRSWILLGTLVFFGEGVTGVPKQFAC